MEKEDVQKFIDTIINQQSTIHKQQDTINNLRDKISYLHLIIDTLGRELEQARRKDI